MPKVYLTEADRLCDRELKKLHGALLAEGITNKVIATWLGCSSQNVGQLWKNQSFSFKQILIIKDNLMKITDVQISG